MGRGGTALLLAVATCVGACAIKDGPHAAAPHLDDASLRRAEGLIREGCYHCLEDALALAHPLAPRSEPARRVAFDAALLLSARDRELGTLASDHLGLARSLSDGSARSRTLLTAVEAMPWPKAAAGPSERDRALMSWRAVEAAAPAWRAQLSSLPSSDLAAEYVLETVDCTYPAEETGPAGSGTPETPPRGGSDAAPLLLFRRAICGPPSGEGLDALRHATPRWDEVALFLGDNAINGGALITAERHYSDAARDFPGMLPALHGLARVHVMLEEYDASLPEYDAILAAVPDQQDCLLGKARALSQLGRHAEALPLLDRLITLGTWLVGDAHYWRGWDRLQLADVEGASADAELALQLMVNARVHVLAGAVAARREDWDRAGREFEAALPLDESDCDIPTSLGSVRGQQRDWPAAFTAYARAAECLVGSQAGLAHRVEEITTALMSPERRERFLARARAAAAAAHRQEGQARYNAAVSLANQGRFADARPWADQASTWPEWRDRANALLQARKP